MGFIAHSLAFYYPDITRYWVEGTVLQSMSSHLQKRRRQQREVINVRVNVQTPPNPYPPQAQQDLVLHLSKLVGRPGSESYSAPSPDPTTPSPI